MVPHTFPPPQLVHVMGHSLAAFGMCSSWLRLSSSLHSLLLQVSVPLPGWQHLGWGLWPLPGCLLPQKAGTASGIPASQGDGSSNLGKAPCSWSDTSLQAVPGVLGSATPRVPNFCSTACGSARAFPLPTPSCSICRRYFPSAAIWAVSFPVPISIFCAGTAACKRSLTGFLGHPRHLGNLKCLGK